jgi:hypothetical protein
MTAAIRSDIVSKWVVVVDAATVTTGAAVEAGAEATEDATAGGGDVVGDDASVVLTTAGVGAVAGAALEPDRPQDASTMRSSAPVRVIRMRQR